MLRKRGFALATVLWVAALVLWNVVHMDLEDKPTLGPAGLHYVVASHIACPNVSSTPGRPRISDGYLGVLSRDGAARIADADGFLIVAFANNAFFDMARNLFHSMLDAGVANFAFCALDREAEQRLADAGIPVFALDADVHASHDLGRTSTFLEANRAKYQTVAKLAGWGFQILVLDVDLVVLAPPAAWLKRACAGVDVAMQIDIVDTTLEPDDNGLEPVSHFTIPPFCVGVMFVRPTPGAIEFFARWNAVMEANVDMLDQTALHEILNAVGAKHKMGDRVQLFGNWVFGALPVLRFCNGHVFNTQQLPQRLGVVPFVAHFTFSTALQVGKVHSMRERLVWHDQPDYYDGFFLAFDLQIPESLMNVSYVPRGAVPEPHIRLANFQLAALARALAIAHVMRRTLILPTMLCLCERYWWFLENCRISHSKVNAIPLPYACPLDHLLRVELFEANGIHVRPSSFLHDPRAPAAIRIKPVAVTPPRGTSTEHHWRALEMPHRRARVIHLDSLGDGFVFANHNQADEFNVRMRNVIGFWCCAESGEISLYHPSIELAHL